MESRIKAVLILLFRTWEQENKTMDQLLQKLLTSCQLLQDKFWWLKCYQSQKILRAVKIERLTSLNRLLSTLNSLLNLRQQPKLKVETVEIKKEIVKTDSLDKTDVSAKKKWWTRERLKEGLKERKVFKGS